MNEEVGFIWKVLIALCAGVFGVAVALAIQHIKIINMPKWLIALAVLVQLLLSWGLFIFICIFFKSGLLPESIPNDEYSALSVAYFCASIPHIVITTAIVIYNKEVNKWLESRYGAGEGMPNMERASGIHAQEEAIQSHSANLVKTETLGAGAQNSDAQNTSAEPNTTALESTQESAEHMTQNTPHESGSDSHMCNACGAKME